MRRSITRENAYYIEPYHTILSMFLFAESSDKKNKRGLTFEQLRLALVAGEDFDKIINYFGEGLREKIKQHIRTKNDLNNTYLKKLLELKLIRKDIRYKKPRYFLSDDFLIYLIRSINKDCLDEYRNDQIWEFNVNEEPRYLLYGLSDNMNLSAAENKQINDCIREIEQIVQKIEKIKIKKLFQLVKIKKEKYENDEKMLRQYLQAFNPHPGICISRFIPGSSRQEYDMERFYLVLGSYPEIFK
jgi:hypothetical protein